MKTASISKWLPVLAGAVLLAMWTNLSFGQIPEVGTASKPEQTVGIIRMSDMGTNEVLDMLEKFTGKPILRQQTLPALKVNFRSQGAMTRSEAILAIESLLSLNGVAITEVGDKLLKAVPSTIVGTQAPQLLEESTHESAPSLKVYSKFYKLSYLTTAEVVPLIQPLLTLGAPIAFEQINSLLITDSLLNLQRIELILEKVDRPQEMESKILFFQLKHTSATDVVKRIKNMQSGNLKRYLGANTTFDADNRTNQLIVFTHPGNVELITDLIDKIDIDVAPLTQTEIFYIKHADATEVTTLIEQVITGQKKSRQESGAAPSTGAAPTTGAAAGTPPTAAGPVEDTLRASAENLQFSDYLTIVADPRGNSILVSGTPNDIIYLKEIIDKIDILLAQVRIEVVITEVTLTKDQARGIESFGVNFNTDDLNEIDFNVNSSSTTQLPQAFSFSGSIKDLTIAAVIDTARRDSRVQVLSAPTIVTTHNREAVIKVGEQRPVITSTQSDLSGGSFVRSSVQFKDIGIELTVKPLIGSNGVIQMEIDQKVDSVVSTVTIDNNEQPVIGTRHATSFVSVGDGELVILGGLQELSEAKKKGRLAFFGSVPIIGSLFGSSSLEQTKRELLIFIQPKIISNTKEAHRDALENIAELEQKRTVEEYIETGDMIGEKEMKKKLRREAKTH